MGNRIPRKFNCIKAEMLVETSCDEPGDIINVYKNDISTGYLAVNKRTGKYAYMFASMLRNENVCRIIEIA